MSDLLVDLEKFKRLATVHGGTTDDITLILYAWACETVVPKPPLNDYLLALLPDVKQRASEPDSTIGINGKVGYTIQEVSRDETLIVVALNKATVSDLNSMLARTHPLAIKHETDASFSFTHGEELAFIPVSFPAEGKYVMLMIAIVKDDTHVGIKWYLNCDGDMVASSKMHVGMPDVLGLYSHENPKTKETYTVRIVEE